MGYKYFSERGGITPCENGKYIVTRDLGPNYEAAIEQLFRNSK